MPSALLREHDAQQGAQSKGEFLGMTGNSSWWLLGSAGLSVFMMLVLWGVFGMPFLLCLVAGLGLCALVAPLRLSAQERQTGALRHRLFRVGPDRSGSGRVDVRSSRPPSGISVPGRTPVAARRRADRPYGSDVRPPGIERRRPGPAPAARPELKALPVEPVGEFRPQSRRIGGAASGVRAAPGGIE